MVGCDPSCAPSNQLTVKVDPKTYAAQACNLLGNAPNNCCLLGQVGSPSLTFIYQNWCCVNHSPEVVIKNIQNVSYITKTGIGKRDARNSDGAFNDNTGIYNLLYWMLYINCHYLLVY
jgi:hypothetical protein